MRSYKGLRQFRFRAAPFTWLYRATRNVCHEYNRARQHEALSDEPPDMSMAPEQQATSADVARQVRALVAKLPARQREVVLLRMFEELSVDETAAAMGCRQGTVKALLHKAKSNLKIGAQQLGYGNDE